MSNWNLFIYWKSASGFRLHRGSCISANVLFSLGTRCPCTLKQSRVFETSLIKSIKHEHECYILFIT